MDVLRLKPGYIIEICGLYVCRMRSGNYHVRCERDGQQFDELFPDAEAAASWFLIKRDELKLGYDKDQTIATENHIG